MSWNLTINLLDVSNNVLATKNITLEHNSLQIMLKSEVTVMLHEYPAIDWKKISVILEKV